MFLYHMDPLQPYFVLNTGVYHKFIPANSPVAHFYQFTYTKKNPAVSGVVPDGAVDLILDTGSGLATISGPVESVEKSPFLEGHTYFGVRFKCEPIQGEGGVNVPPEDYLPKMRELCTKYDVFFCLEFMIEADVPGTIRKNAPYFWEGLYRLQDIS